MNIYWFTTLCGKFLKKIIPSGLEVPILSGTLRGKKWVTGTSNFECILGTYEHKKHILFEKELFDNDIVYDIGAHVGFYTLLASKVIGDAGKVVSFEPFPQNFKFLKNHIKLNECKNVILVETAVADFNDISLFQEGEGTSMGHLSKYGEITVKTISLDTFIEKNPNLIPNCLKIDVEGSEFSVLKGSQFLIKKYHPKIFLATHNKYVHEKCVDFLYEHGYHLKLIDKKNEIFAF